MKEQAELGLNLSTRRTRKAVFLDKMELVVPWRELVSLIATASPAASTGRPPFARETMLRIHFRQQWFGKKSVASTQRLSIFFTLKAANSRNSLIYLGGTLCA